MGDPPSGADMFAGRSDKALSFTGNQLAIRPRSFVVAGYAAVTFGRRRRPAGRRSRYACTVSALDPAVPAG